MQLHHYQCISCISPIFSFLKKSTLRELVTPKLLKKRDICFLLGPKYYSLWTSYPYTRKLRPLFEGELLEKIGMTMDEFIQHRYYFTRDQTLIIIKELQLEVGESSPKNIAKNETT